MCFLPWFSAVAEGSLNYKLFRFFVDLQHGQINPICHSAGYLLGFFGWGIAGLGGG